MNNKNRFMADGWTFIETLIVMCIVMILSATVGVSSIRQIDKARVVSAKTMVSALSNAMDSMYFDLGYYPDSTDGLNLLWTNMIGADNWNGPYITKPVPKDPWGNDYIFKVPGTNGLPFEILSYGKDGSEGGEGLEKDISSAQ